LLAVIMDGVSVGVVGRSAEFRAIADFLGSVNDQPAGLLVEGEAGIGKTTLWLAALEQARQRGFHVLSARAWEAESVLAYGTVTDLLGDVDAEILAGLPAVQRVAVDRVLLHDVGGGPLTDQQVVAAALMTVVATLASQAPVLIAIDDVQRLDPSSRAVVSFVARRLRGRVCLIATARTEPDRESVLSWLQLGTPDGISRMNVGPLSLGGVHELLSARLGRAFPRPTMVRIADVSGGNPFYAIEIGRAIDGQKDRPDADLPHTLADLVRFRTRRLNADANNVLLAASCVANPTVDMLARATGTSIERTTELLEDAENHGAVVIDGNRVHYSHPLLAHGVYADAAPARRRQMHRALADVVTQPELKARHLALAASSKDPELLQALDDAAKAAIVRGAPAAAAELLDLAIKLGGDTPSRRIRSAGHHLRAGDTERAHAVLEPALEQLPAGAQRALALNLLAGLWVYRRSFSEASRALKRALGDAEDNPLMLTQTLLMLSFAQANSGEYEEALRNSVEAVKHAESMGIPVMTSQAVADWQVLSALCGHGFDESSLQRALDLEDLDIDVPIPFRAHSAAAQVLSWAGRLDEAREHVDILRRRCMERGADTDMLFVSVWGTLIDVWRADFTEGAHAAADAIERAEQIGGDHGLVIALTVRGLVAAYTGHEVEARADAHAAIEAADRFGAPLLAEWPRMTLGFLDVSVGDHERALDDLRPLIADFGRLCSMEIIKAWFIPDAVEAMVAVGRLGEAEPMVAALESHGSRLDRTWMLAIGARCRAMLMAAQGDVDGAERVVRKAIAEHARLPMPFERARTLLLLGQLQRRKRQKQGAAATLGEALQVFQELGTPLWAARVSAELERTNVTPMRTLELTPSERRVAELAAEGLTNRDVAGKLFVSTKTVEANLTQIYRKLGIHSRAELGRLMSR
jgi:DNA-binding CsgD family transcriptional regulator/nucleoside-triphosphatase THEP1